MSRLFVKGLPGSLTSKELHQHFQQSGFTPTDAKVMHRPDGSSKGFGFVGLQNEAETTKAKNELHQTFIHGSRLQVSFAKEIAMNNTHEPKSKRRKLNADTITKPLPLPTELPAGDEEQTEAEPDAKVTDSTISDADYFASRLKRKLGDTLEQQPEEQEEALEDIKQDDAKQDDLTKSILQTGRLFVRNLAYHATADAISSHFSRFGSCTLHLPAEQDRASTGVAYVHYADAQDAINAHQTLDGKPFLGRLMHVLPSVDRFAPPQPAKFIADPKKKAKFQEEHGQKSSATLVTNTDAVASSLAARLGLDKRDIIDATQSSSAVKLALAETSLLDETRRYCALQGIDLDALSQGGPKSSTVLLLKNLPAGTTANTLNNLISQYGQTKRLAIPPSATLAFVEFEDAAASKSAQRSLSYQKLGNSVIYVERMPASLWHDTPISLGTSTEISLDADPKNETETVDEEPPSTTLFVQNVGFATSSDSFERLFRSLPGFSYATLQPKRGFGFVGFKSIEHATSAKEKMDGVLLETRPLKLQFSSRSADQQEEDDALGPTAKGKKWSTKLVVKNVPFEASAKDLRQLFSAVATLKSLRLPKRADKRSRGFAFVEFASSKDSAAAAQMLKHTHLLGRHLVLEESAEEDKPSIDFL